MPKIFLYAEILTHIRQLTLHASLQTEKREGTKVDISIDKKVITVTHDGETQRLYLPTQISGTAVATFPLERKTELSARVQIEDEQEWKLTINNEIQAPWMAADLTTTTAIICRQCKSSILATGASSQWKDLPSENWAELMDFWFCHKPQDEDIEEAAEAKGFSSKSKLAVAPGIGMTDLISIVLHPDDCTNVKAAEKHKSPDATVLRCNKCLSMLGTTNQDEELIRLHKSSISVKISADTASYQSYASSIFTCAQVLSLIEATAIKRFVVHSTRLETEGSDDDAKARPLVLWIFNPDIYYSCSAYDGDAVLTDAAPPEPNPNSDDVSNIYGEQSVDPEYSESTEPGQEADHTNPNNDNTSAIYGEPSGPKFVSGDIEFEMPLRKNGEPEPTSSHIDIESVTETETPLVVTKKQDESVEPGDPVSSTHPQSANTTNPQTNDHINLVHRATKVFYQALPTNTSAAEYLDSNSSTYEDLYLPNMADLVHLRDTLEKSTSMLPASARSFQDWSVGLLDRYEKIPSGLGVMQENPLARKITARDGRITRWSVGNGAEGLYA